MLAESATKRSLSVDQVTYINIIRALSAELVLLGHGFLYFFKDVNTYIGLGSLGVVLFFLVSGFLISRSVLTNLRIGDYTFSDYLIERFARIYTAFVPALALIAIIDYFLINHPRFPYTDNYTFWDAVGSLLMLEDFPILLILHHIGWRSWSIEAFSSARTFWTLPIEWWIYVTFGVLFFSIKNRSWTVLRLIILALASLYPLYHFIARTGGSLTGVWMMGLGSSALYYWAENSQIDRAQDRPCILRTALILTLLMLPMALTRLVYANRDVYDMAFTVLLAVILFAPLFVLKLHPVRVPNLIRLSAHHLASYSYTLYLIHTTFMIAVLTLYPEWISGPVSLILMLAGINVAAICFAHVFELRYHVVAERLKAFLNWLR
jgi:peptidoglycan/LPS O-acetylase OafA/YrhL